MWTIPDRNETFDGEEGEVDGAGWRIQKKWDIKCKNQMKQWIILGIRREEATEEDDTAQPVN